jgi:SAP domain-containing ribonucleoprotein
METKLKALKVADLKAVLAKAAVQPPARATKADLISRILASQPAQDAYRAIYEP